MASSCPELLQVLERLGLGKQGNEFASDDTVDLMREESVLSAFVAYLLVVGRGQCRKGALYGSVFVGRNRSFVV